MPAVTSTGSVATKTLLVSTGSGITVLANGSGSLLQSANASITGSGTTVLFLGRVTSNDNNNCQVELSVDGTVIFSGASGDQIITRASLSSGSHTVVYTAYALGSNATISAAGLTAIDLGL